MCSNLDKQKDYGIKDLAVFVAGFWFLSIFLMMLISQFDSDTAGKIGDSFGAINSLFAGLGLAGVYLNLRQQSHMLKQQEEAIEANNEVTNKHLSTLETQNRVLQEQAEMALASNLIAVSSRLIQQEYSTLFDRTGVSGDNKPSLPEFEAMQPEDLVPYIQYAESEKLKCVNHLKKLNSEIDSKLTGFDKIKTNDGKNALREEIDKLCISRNNYEKNTLGYWVSVVERWKNVQLLKTSQKKTFSKLMNLQERFWQGSSNS